MIGGHRALAISLFAFAACHQVLAQASATANLIIDVANVVEYRGDITDITQFARNPNITPTAEVGNGPGQTPNFALNTVIGDIVAVNGQPAKGLFAAASGRPARTRTPLPGGPSRMSTGRQFERTFLRFCRPMERRLGRS